MNYLLITTTIILFFILQEIWGGEKPTTKGISTPQIHSLIPTARDPIFLSWKKMIQEQQKKMRIVPAIPLIEARFARYQAKSGDHLWSIISTLSLDMDTIAQINDLASLHDIKKGDWIIIPNMRGVLREIKNGDTFTSLSKEWKIPLVHLMSANTLPIIINQKPYVFIPGGKFSDLERSLFHGTAFLSPLAKGIISSTYGMRKDPFTDRNTFHGGLDIAAPTGTSVYAARKGKIIFSGPADGYGQLIIIQHSLAYETYYGHLSKILKRKGIQVNAGELIGRVGSTGRSTGPHLHFEVRREGKRFNPQNFIRNLQHK